MPVQFTPADERPPLPATAIGAQDRFVGREGELGLLIGQFDGALAGRSGVALVAGEAGIGKTRLLEELATAARTRGARVCWGRCQEGEGAPAFWPWVQVVRACLRGRDAAAVRVLLGGGAPEIVALAPELGGLLGDVPAPPALDAAQARFQLFDAVASLLSAAATDAPLLVLLDDLHWADTPSLLLLEFVARAR